MEKLNGIWAGVPGDLQSLILTTLAVIGVMLAVIMAVAFSTLAERKVIGYMQLRRGPNRISLFGLPFLRGLAQPFADVIKLLLKEFLIPANADRKLFLIAPLIVLGTAKLGSAILTEASLSFLGLGIPEPHPSWGRMLSESAAEYMRTAPWLVIFPGIAISLAVFGTNLLGDAIRDILDPRQRS